MFFKTFISTSYTADFEFRQLYCGTDFKKEIRNEERNPRAKQLRGLLENVSINSFEFLKIMLCEQ